MHTPRLRSLLVAAVATSALVAGSAGAAGAGTWSHTDATGDVLAVDPVQNDATTTPAPDRATGDIRKVVIKHTARKVVVRVGMRAWLTGRGWAVVGHIVTPRTRYEVRGIRPSDKGRKFVVLVHKPGPREKSLRCRGLAATENAAGGVLTFTVPRSCLGAPKWVRVNASTYDWDGPERTFADDGMDDVGWIKQVLSPKIRRG